MQFIVGQLLRILTTPLFGLCHIIGSPRVRMMFTHFSFLKKPENCEIQEEKSKLILVLQEGGG